MTAKRTINPTAIMSESETWSRFLPVDHGSGLPLPNFSMSFACVKSAISDGFSPPAASITATYSVRWSGARYLALLFCLADGVGVDLVVLWFAPIDDVVHSGIVRLTVARSFSTLCHV